jgi:hypothetical protein
MLEHFIFLGFAGIIPYIVLQTLFSRLLTKLLKVETNLAVNFARHFIAFCLYMVFLFFMLTAFSRQGSPTLTYIVIGVFFLQAIFMSLFYEFGNLYVQKRFINDNPKVGKMSKAMTSIFFFMMVVPSQTLILRLMSGMLPPLTQQTEIGPNGFAIFFYHMPAYLLGIFLYGLYEFKKLGKE